MKILFFGEPLIRITPDCYQNLDNNQAAYLYYGGSEVNIARSLSYMGIPCKLFTALPNNEIGDSYLNFLERNNIDVSAIVRKGQRLGTYYLIDGYGWRNSQVCYDRAYTSINDLKISDLDFDEIFRDITHFHFSGITIALSDQVRLVLTALLEEACQRKVTVSIDLNYRSKLLSLIEAKDYFSKYAKYATYCFGIDPLKADANDNNLFNRESASQKELEKRMSSLLSIYNFKYLFHTRRTVKQNVNDYLSYVYYQDKLVKSQEFSTAVLQRVGSGDAFITGALYQILNNKSPKEIIDFASACAIYKCTVSQDSMLAKPETIHDLMKSNDVVR